MPKKTVPAKNIIPILVDVRKPGFNYNRTKTAELNLGHVPQKPVRSKGPKIFFWGATVCVAVVIALAAGLVALNLGTIKRSLAEKGELIVNNFSTSIDALKSFKPGQAVSSLSQNNKELSSLNDFLAAGQGRTFMDVLGGFVPTLKNAGSFIGQVTKLNFDFLNLSSILADLEVNGFGYFVNNGPVLVRELSGVHDLIADVIAQTESVKNTTANLKDASSFFGRIDDTFGKDYLKYSSDLYSWNNSLSALLKIISSEADRHILLFFQNPAELRPGGGFIGSYADLTVSNGQMRKMDVRDIYDPDGQLALKMVPPWPLQTITHDWGARDANWFFDFPTSARTVVDFMEKSKMYSEKNITFDGAIALNINVLESVLDLTGPIALPDYKLTIDKSNFLNEIQREVEAGKDRQTGYPKHILQVLTPLIMEKLNNLKESDVSGFMETLRAHLAKKDIMVFAKDPNLASLFASTDTDGAVYELPNDFWGSYLGVVNANVAGGKSDVFVDQVLTGNIDIDTDGGIFTDLTVARTHRGGQEKDSWWRATNQDYIQIFTNPNSNLFSLKGSDKKTMATPSGYGDYSVNPDLAAIENTQIALSRYNAWSTEAFGKKVFSTWLNTPAGQTKTLNLRYQTPAPKKLELQAGTVYQFIFDRQSGTVSDQLNFSISAPLGFVWAENSSPSFVYQNNDPPGRIILNLTLAKS